MVRSLLLLTCLGLLGCDSGEKSKPTEVKTKIATETKKQALEVPTKAESPKPMAVREEELERQPMPGEAQPSEELKAEVAEDAPPIPDTFKPLNKAKNLFFEKVGESRRVHLLANVCLREGPLEVFLCKTNTKEHESILNIDADAREIHFALIAAGALAGSPVKFVPKYESATGTKIKVSLTYREKGKIKTVAAQEWVKDKKTEKDMRHDWVFTGSKFFKDPEKPNAVPYYMANNGEIISLANFPDSMMDLPVKSPKDAADLIYEINTARIPPLRTPVLITFEPVLEKK